MKLVFGVTLKSSKVYRKQRYSISSICYEQAKLTLLEIEEKLTNNLAQIKVPYLSFIKWDHYYSLKKLVLCIACLLKLKQL